MIAHYSSERATTYFYCCHNTDTREAALTFYLQGATKLESRRADSNRCPAHYECAARHLSATERLTSRTAALSPDASTEATLNGLLIVAPTRRCRKRRMASPTIL